jgi:hypothetical protein
MDTTISQYKGSPPPPKSAFTIWLTRILVLSVTVTSNLDFGWISTNCIYRGGGVLVLFKENSSNTEINDLDMFDGSMMQSFKAKKTRPFQKKQSIYVEMICMLGNSRFKVCDSTPSEEHDNCLKFS